MANIGGRNQNTLSAKSLAASAILLCMETVTTIAETWEHTGIAEGPNGERYCQIISQGGLGLRLFDTDYFLLALVGVDAKKHPGMQKIIDFQTHRVVLQPDNLGAHTNLMRHESSSTNSNGQKVHLFALSTQDFHLLEAMQAAKQLHVIVTEDFSRALERRLDDIDYSVSLSGSRKAIDALKNCLTTYWNQSASQGDANAQYDLARRYDNGHGILKQDYKKAATWYRKAAEKGHMKAQTNLGHMLETGSGVLQNYDEAVNWFRMASNQGDFQAQHNLGVLYSDGIGVLQDHAEAAKWYSMAAEQGYAGSQSNLGMLYEKGLGVRQNIVFAHLWYNLAAAQGDTEAQADRDRITKQMTTDQLNEAQRLAREWRPQSDR